jgi:GNAT superfamily N-acetyltransferase
MSQETNVERTERLEIVCDLAPNAEDIKRLRAGLMSYNESRAGAVDIKPIALYVRDGSGEIRGGLFGYLAWQWLSIDLLWVEESLRGRGYGASLLRQAETAARDAGCVAVRLDTYEFQARPFYEHHGYVVYGTLEGYPAGTRTYLLTKSLGNPPTVAK